MTVADLTDPTAPPTRIGPESNGMLLSVEEYDATADWDAAHRYELINGVLVVLPPPGFGERSPNDYLGYLLNKYREEHASGACVDLTLPEQEVQCGANRRRADRAIWIGLGRMPNELNDQPTIAIEFVSDSSRDRRRDYVDKRVEYAAAGVQEYWVIDRFARQLTVFRGEEEILVPESKNYSPPLIPGFELPLSVLLAKADQGGPAE